MKFIGRDKELKNLKRVLTREQLLAVLIYGRRRVGKSELIKQCLRENAAGTVLYYECKQTTEISNVRNIATLIAEKFNFPEPNFSSFEEVFSFLCKMSIEQPIILVLDEYPFLRELVKGLDSILKSLLDEYKESGKLKLILCGSFVDVMKALLMVENPLYGRIDLTIDLKPMDYYDSSLFYPNFSDEDKVRLYSVFGGIPYYNRLIDSSLSVKENIIELLASPNARLENEVSMYLKSEISRMNNANEVFDALSKGFSKFKDILSQSNVSSGPTLIDVLEKLIRMDVVAKESPINDANNKRKASYSIIDNISAFYYRYIFRYMSQMAIMDPEIFYDMYIHKDFEEQYVPERFERICKQYLIRQNKSGKLNTPFFRIGKYYYDDPVNHCNGEFDVVTEDEHGYIFYEAKFRQKPLPKSLLLEEISQVEKINIQCYRYGFISRSGYDHNVSEIDNNKITLIRLSELYSL